MILTIWKEQNQCVGNIDGEILPLPLTQDATLYDLNALGKEIISRFRDQRISITEDKSRTHNIKPSVSDTEGTIREIYKFYINYNVCQYIDQSREEQRFL